MAKPPSNQMSKTNDVSTVMIAALVVVLLEIPD